MGTDLAKLHQEMQDGIKALVSGEDWQRSLEVGARFHRYSWGNCMLIVRQRPDAVRVAGYRTWQSLGRQVRKGEHGIRILAPLMYRKRDDTEETDGAMVLRGFRVVSVFDVAQTEGEPLPDVAPVRLDGEAPAGLWDELAGKVDAEGFSLARGIPTNPSANGETHGPARRVIVRPDLSEAQACKTLAHELAHIKLGHVADGLPCQPRSLAEVEAESVAFLVCASRGLVTDSYSFAYIATWSQGDPKKVASVGERVMTCARGILEGSTRAEAA